MQDHVVVGQQVDIDRTRAPALLPGTVAAERALHRLRALQQRMWREPGFDCDAEIDERRLVLDPPGRRAVVRGAGQQTHPLVTECGDRAIEGGAYIADIAAKRDQRFSHISVSRSPGGNPLAARPRSNVGDTSERARW